MITRFRPVHSATPTVAHWWPLVLVAAGRAEDWNGRAVSRSVTLHDGQRPRSVTAASSCCCVPERTRALSACVRVRE
jgi:hypothetical protein